MHYAAETGYIDIVNVLFHSKANIKIKDKVSIKAMAEFDCGNIFNVCLLSLQRGRTPLHLASDNGQTEVVKIFSAVSNTNNDAVDDMSLNKVCLILYI